MSERDLSEGWMKRGLAQAAMTHGRMFYRIAFDILRNAAAAEDACQQAFLKAWEHQQQLREHGALKGWLTQTVIRECLSTHRRGRTEKRALDAQFKVAPAWADQHDPGAGEQREKVLAGVRELPEPVRTVVVLRILEGMSGNEVKDLLECSAVDVSRQLHQGMDMLREKLRGSFVRTGEL